MATATNDMKLVFEKTDFMQQSWYTLGLAVRPKTVHSVGVVQEIKWVPEANNGYTGMFSSGADYGIIRYSVGT